MAVERDPYEVLQVSRYADWSDIRAAYRALARRYHPDGTAPDDARMIELNAAYECLERSHRADASSVTRGVPVGPGRPSGNPGARPAASDLGEGSLLRRMRQRERPESPVLDFGRYSGWRLAEVAECDPGYLEWLSRHSSGVRYRPAIEGLLGPSPEIGRRATVVR